MSNKKKVKNGNSSPRQSRTFTFELYPEWPFFNNIITRITKEKYALICHDKDTFDDGTIKKQHVHVVVKYGGKRTADSVKNEYSKYGLEKRFVDTCNERAMLRYLIHLDDPDKYQYSRNEVDTNMKVDCESAWNDEITSEEGFRMLNDYILSSDRKISQAEMNDYALKKGLTKGLRAFGNQLNNARIERNRELEYRVEENRMHDMMMGLQNRIAELEHNYKVSAEENMRLRGIDIDDEKEDVWEGLDEYKK